MKPLLLTSVLILAGCANTGIGTAVATVGIAGAGLTAYCIANGAGCSNDVIAYGILITTEATKDASILESGSTTVQAIEGIVANLNADIQQGRVLVGVSSGAQTEVAAIVGGINALLPLVVALETKAPTSSASVTIPALSVKDKNAITRMKTKIMDTKRASVNWRIRNGQVARL